jgi:fatty acid desaturase
MVASRLDDHSNAFGKLRFQVRDTSGGMLVDFLKTLQPDYSVVYRDIAFGYAALIVSVAAAVLAERAGAPFWLVTPLAALSIGYWIAYLMLFLHEGAHWNLAADPRVSDRICNGLVSWWAGLEVSKYRPIHFQHHRALGTTEDSEFSYFFPLNLVFITKGLLGIRAVEVLLARERMTKSQDKKAEAGVGSVPPERKHAVIGALFHLTCIGALALSGNWASAAAWAMGVGAVFPFFGALRQLLEHRAEDARANVITASPTTARSHACSVTASSGAHLAAPASTATCCIIGSRRCPIRAWPISSASCSVPNSLASWRRGRRPMAKRSSD